MTREDAMVKEILDAHQDDSSICELLADTKPYDKMCEECPLGGFPEEECVKRYIAKKYKTE